MKATYPLVSQLTKRQQGHLAWRLDRHTYCGYFSAIRVATCQFKDIPLNEIFEFFGMTTHQAKIHARKVVNF